MPVVKFRTISKNLPDYASRFLASNSNWGYTFYDRQGIHETPAHTWARRRGRNSVECEKTPELEAIASCLAGDLLVVTAPVRASGDVVKRAP